MRSAALIRRSRLMLLHPYAKAVTGVHIVAEPVEVLDTAASHRALGAAVRRTLDHYVAGAPHPDPSLSLEDPVLRAAKVKTWAALTQGAKEVEILEKDTTLVFRPTENRGARQGFWHCPDLDVTVPIQSDDEAIGAAAMRALDLSR